MSQYSQYTLEDEDDYDSGKEDADVDFDEFWGRKGKGKKKGSHGALRASPRDLAWSSILEDASAEEKDEALQNLLCGSPDCSRFRPEGWRKVQRGVVRIRKLRCQYSAAKDGGCKFVAREKQDFSKPAKEQWSVEVGGEKHGLHSCATVGCLLPAPSAVMHWQL